MLVLMANVVPSSVRRESPMVVAAVNLVMVLAVPDPPILPPPPPAIQEVFPAPSVERT